VGDKGGKGDRTLVAEMTKNEKGFKRSRKKREQKKNWEKRVRSGKGSWPLHAFYRRGGNMRQTAEKKKRVGRKGRPKDRVFQGGESEAITAHQKRKEKRHKFLRGAYIQAPGAGKERTKDVTLPNQGEKDGKIKGAKSQTRKARGRD